MSPPKPRVVRFSVGWALLVFGLAVAALVPPALGLDQHGDETQYIWTARHFGAKLAHGDLRPEGTNDFVDPGWAARQFWTICEPMGARLLYALALGVARSDVPALPYSFTNPALQGPETLTPAATLLTARLTAVAAAALGLALIASRVGAPGALGAALFLGIPHVRADLARAWAEGPLLLGYGLCTIAYGTRWFSAAAGVAATFKLTALGLWPLVFWSASRSNLRFAGTRALAVSATVWTALTPPSWYGGGPLYLAAMVMYRVREYSQQSAAFPSVGGVFVPTRYGIPVELCLALAASWAALRLARHFAARGPFRRAPSPVGLA